MLKDVTFYLLSSDFIYSYIGVGNDVVIHEHTSFIASISTSHIGNKVLFGPNITIYGGNYRCDIVGNTSDSAKRSSDDEDVYIEEDIWVG